MSDQSRHDVIIVGAGLAGLRCAQVLSRRGLDVIVIDRAPHVGGRVHSFDLDGYIIDEGFQLINPAYPELRATGVIPQLDLRRFPAAVTFRTPETEWTLADPRRAPWRAVPAVLRGHLPLGDAWALGKVFTESKFSSVRRLTRGADLPTRDGFLAAGVSPGTVTNVITPFLQGTLLDSELDTSWHYTRLLLKSFANGRPSTPSNGARTLPRAMVTSMPQVTMELGNRVHRVSATSVDTDMGTRSARAVVIATDQDSAAWLMGGGSAGWRATTTWWFTTPPVAHGERLRLDLVRRSVASILDVASVAPERAPHRRTLLAVAVNGEHDARRDLEMRTDVARFYNLDRADVELLTRTTVARALPRIATPLRLNRPATHGDLFVAGDYLQTPSIQGALVSGRRAAHEVLAALATPHEDFWPLTRR